MATPVADATTPRYFLLDMGKEKYGDSLLCFVGGKTILIDGGHPGDFDGQSGSDSLPDQIGAILNASPPYAIDLLIVTHPLGSHRLPAPDGQGRSPRRNLRPRSR